MAVTSEARAFQHRLCGFGLFLLFVGVAGVAGLEVARRRIAQTAQWPAVKGQMVTSEVVTGTVKNGRVLIVSPHAKTVYTFSVDGKNYVGEGRRVIPMLHFDTEGTPEQVVAKYPVGKSVKVYYNPNDPSDALLTPVPAEDARMLIDSLSWLSPGIAGVGLLIAGLAGVKLWRERDLAPKVLEIGKATAPAVLPLATAARPVELPRPPQPPRTTHWIVRGLATLLGLGLFSFGTLVCLTVARMDIPRVSRTMHVVTLVIFAGVTVFGALLIWFGMRRPRVNVQSYSGELGRRHDRLATLR